MTWIESHQEVLTHPKLRRLCRRLDVERPAAIGYLHMLWWWCVDYADDGDLGRWQVEDIEDAMDWRGQPSALVDALVETGWLDQADDGRLSIHDWYVYAGRIMERREANRTRQRAFRERQKTRTDGVTNAHVTVTDASLTRTSPATIKEEAPRNALRNADVDVTNNDVRVSHGATVPDLTIPDHTGPDLTPSASTRARAKRTPPAPATPTLEVVRPLSDQPAHASEPEPLMIPAAARPWHDAMDGEPDYVATPRLLDRVAAYAESGVDVGEEALKLRSWLASKQDGKKIERYSDLRALNWLKRARDDAPRPIRMTPPPTSARPAVNGAKDWNRVARFITPSTNAVPTTETTA